MNNKIIVCDFDGTITKEDSIDTFLNRYACGDWRVWEKYWLEGKVGSRDCIKHQLELIKGMDNAEFMRFVDSIEIDEHFKDFYYLCKECGIKLVIVSDGFDIIIQNVLSRHGLNDIDVYTNHLELVDGEFKMEFPNISETCKKGSGTCKCKVVNYLKDFYKTIYYVGDGISDFCVSAKADFVFAKKRLLNYCRNNDIDCIEYNTFEDLILNDSIGLNKVCFC